MGLHHGNAVKRRLCTCKARAKVRTHSHKAPRLHSYFISSFDKSTVLVCSASMSDALKNAFIAFASYGKGQMVSWSRKGLTSSGQGVVLFP